MTRPAIMLPFISSDTTLPKLDYAAYKAAGRPWEEFTFIDNIAGDWCFDQGDDANLRSRIGSRRLTKAGADPAYGAAVVTPAAGGINGLRSEIADRRVWSYFAVVKVPPVPADGLVMVADASGASQAQGGEFLFFRTGDGQIRLNVRGYAAQIGTQAPPVGSHVFVGVASRITGGTASEHALHVGTGAGLHTDIGAGTKTLSTEGRPLGLGLAHNTTLAYAAYTTDFQRFGMFTRYVAPAEMLEIYRMAKVIAQRRGIVVV